MKSELAYANSPGRSSFCTNKQDINRKSLCILTIDFLVVLWYNMSVKRKKRGNKNENIL